MDIALEITSYRMQAFSIKAIENKCDPLKIQVHSALEGHCDGSQQPDRRLEKG